MSSTKYCKECRRELPKEAFYKTYGKSLSTLCKVHSNEKRKKLQREKPKVKKQLGFKKLDEAVREKILKDISDGVKLITIAEANNIKYPTLLSWKKNGQLI